MGSFAGLSIPHYRFLEGPVIEDDKNIAYQLYGFCDASNQALSVAWCKWTLVCVLCAGQGQS